MLLFWRVVIASGIFQCFASYLQYTLSITCIGWHHAVQFAHCFSHDEKPFKVRFFTCKMCGLTVRKCRISLFPSFIVSTVLIVVTPPFIWGVVNGALLNQTQLIFISKEVWLCEQSMYLPDSQFRVHARVSATCIANYRQHAFASNEISWFSSSYWKFARSGTKWLLFFVFDLMKKVCFKAGKSAYGMMHSSFDSLQTFPTSPERKTKGLKTHTPKAFAIIYEAARWTLRSRAVRDGQTTDVGNRLMLDN